MKIPQVCKIMIGMSEYFQMLADGCQIDLNNAAGSRSISGKVERSIRVMNSRASICKNILADPHIYQKDVWRGIAGDLAGLEPAIKLMGFHVEAISRMMKNDFDELRYVPAQKDSDGNVVKAGHGSRKEFNEFRRRAFRAYVLMKIRAAIIQRILSSIGKNKISFKGVENDALGDVSATGRLKSMFGGVVKGLFGKDIDETLEKEELTKIVGLDGKPFRK